MNICILQIDSQYVPTMFVPECSGLWRVQLSGISEFYAGTRKCLFGNIPLITPEKIGSLRFGLETMFQVDSYDECWNYPGSYWYNNEEYYVIMNIAVSGVGFQVPFGKRFEIGIIIGFCDRADRKRELGCWYSGTYHKPTLLDIPSFTSKRDNMQYGVISYNDMSLKLDNGKGDLDGVTLLGNIARIYSVPEGEEPKTSNLRTKGYVSKYTRNYKMMQITIGDPRRALTMDMTLGNITVSEFPHLSDDLIKEVQKKPILIGPFEKYVPVCVNPKQSGQPVQFLVGAVNGENCTFKKYSSNAWFERVYRHSSDDEDVDIDLAYTFDNTTGILTVARDLVADGDDDTEIEEIYINGYGWHNASPNTSIGETSALCGVDLIKLALTVIAKEQWNAALFDFSTWGIERAKSVRQSRVYSSTIKDKKTVSDFIADVCKAGDTIFTPRNDGRWAVRVDAEVATPSVTIRSDHILDDSGPSEVGDLSNIRSTIQIKYGTAENRKTLTDDELEESTRSEYHMTTGTDESNAIDTILADKASAQKKADREKELRSSPDVQVTLTVPIDSDMEGLDVIDALIAPCTRDGVNGLFDLISKEESVKDNTIKLTAKKRLQYEYSDEYIQGCAIGAEACGAGYMGITQEVA